MVEGSQIHLGSFFRGAFCVPPFFEPLFSLELHISHCAKFQSPFARYSCNFFGAPNLFESSAPTPGFRYSVAKIPPCHKPQKRKIETAARCQVV